MQCTCVKSSFGVCATQRAMIWGRDDVTFGIEGGLVRGELLVSSCSPFYSHTTSLKVFLSSNSFMRSGCCCCCWSPPRTHYYPPPPNKAARRAWNKRFRCWTPKKRVTTPQVLLKKRQHMPSYRSPAQMTHYTLQYTHIYTNLKNAARSTVHNNWRFQISCEHIQCSLFGAKYGARAISRPLAALFLSDCDFLLDTYARWPPV